MKKQAKAASPKRQARSAKAAAKPVVLSLVQQYEALGMKMCNSPSRIKTGTRTGRDIGIVGYPVGGTTKSKA